MAADILGKNAPPARLKSVTYFDLGVLFYSIIFHFVDVGYDIHMALNYFRTAMYSYFAWTIAFILIPSVIMAVISIKMYIDDSRDSGKSRGTFTRIALCIVGLILQSAPLIRYCDSFYYACKSFKAKQHSDKEKQEKYYNKMANEDSDVSLLRVFECYLESAPQQVLQVTMLLLDFIRGSNDYTTNQFIILILSFVFMGVCMANYNRLLRHDQSDEKRISKLGLLFQFLWHLNFTVSRILTIAAVATLHPLGTGLAVFCHWILMSTWVAVCIKTCFCEESKVGELLFSGAIGLIYIFNYLNLRDGPTRKFYLVFYVLCFVENLSASVLWAIYSIYFKHNWIYYIFAILPVLTFVLSIIFFAIYYQFLHPSLKKNDKLLSDKKQSSFQEQEVSLNEKSNCQI